MVYVYPIKERIFIVNLLMWPIIVAQILVLHFDLGLGYAVYWANRSFLVPQSIVSDVPIP